MRDRQRRRANAGKVLGRLFEEQGLLDLEPDLDLLLPRARQLLLRPLAVGDVFRDPDQVLRGAIGAEHGHLDGVEEAQAAMGRLDRLFRDVHHLPACEHGPILGFEEPGLLLREEVVVALADRRAAIDPERFLLGPVPAHEPQVLGVFHEQHDREMLEDRVQEVPRVLELGGAASQCFLGPAIFRDLSFQLGLRVPRCRRVVSATATSRLGAVEDAVDTSGSHELTPDRGQAIRQRVKRQDHSQGA